MSEALRESATEVVRQLRGAGFVALFAGGCVRDLLLGREPKDYDVATTATPDEVRQLFGHRRTLAVGASFGVIIVLGRQAGVQVEVATFRREGEYSDGRRPDRVEYCTPEEDAHRRDFTINGMFYDPIDSQVLDYVGGERDLAAGVVRAIGDPHDRMREDKLRMLRAIRFTATLDFQLDAVTLSAVQAMAAQLIVVSAERIAQELRKMLVDAHRRRAMQLCIDSRLMEILFPELIPAADLGGNLKQPLQMLHLLREPRFELALATLLADLPAEAVVRKICRRLKLSNEETDRIVWLVAHHDDLRSAPGWTLAQLKRALSHPYHDDQQQLLHVKLLTEGADPHATLFCADYLARTPMAEINPPPLVTGDDLIRLGLTPGPHFKSLLDQVRDAQLNGEIQNQAEALHLAQRLHGLGQE